MLGKTPVVRRRKETAELLDGLFPKGEVGRYAARLSRVALAARENRALTRCIKKYRDDCRPTRSCGVPLVTPYFGRSVQAGGRLAGRFATRIEVMPSMPEQFGTMLPGAGAG